MSEQFVLPILPVTGNSFDTFVTGDNVLSLAAAREWALGNPGQIYLWGDPGSGVSHLLEAMAVACEGVLLSCRLLKEQSPEILEGLENCPYLMLDDLDDLAGLPEWETSLFHLYNRVRALGGSIAFGAKRPPGALGILLPDLRSRLSADAVFRVEPLDDKGLLAMARLWAANRGMTLGEGVPGYLALRLPRSGGAWRQALETLDRESLSQQRKVTVPFVRSLFPGWS